MKIENKRKLTSVFMAFGIALILLSVAMVVVTEIVEKKYKESAEEIVFLLKDTIPDAVDSVPDDRINTTMAVFQIGEEDFIGLIELPSFNKVLPVCNRWDKMKVSEYPCKYMGSVFDDCLIIGGSDNEGQFDFIKTISNGDTVSFTDVTGQRFNYTVTDIRKTKDVSTEKLTSKEADLVLFARNTFSFDYTVIRCDLKNRSN